MLGVWQRWQPRLAILWLLLALGAAAWATGQLVDGRKIETNLLALLPATERNPQAEAAVNTLADALGNRALFLIGHRDPATAQQQARRFAEALQQAGAFKRVVAEAPPADAALLLDFYRPQRGSLLAPADRSALEKPAFQAEARLQRRLHQPFAGGLATPLAEDPFGFWQQWLQTLPLTQSRLSIADGQLVVRDGDRLWVLVLGELPGSAYDDRVQNAIIEAFATARAAATVDGLSILHTGGVFYGAAARSSAEREVDLIGAGSLIGILLMMFWLFRSLKPLALALLTVALGMGCALAATLAVYGQLHLLTLVFGASLIGEAVDYAIQYFAAQLDAGPHWEPKSGLQRIVRPLAVALATSLIGYGALALTPFPAIGQIALFAFTGLAAAWLSVILLLPWLTRRPMMVDASGPTRLPRALLAAWRARMTPRRAGWLVLGLIVAAAPGWWQLHGNDDIRLLVTRPAELQAEEAKIRQLAGFSGGSRFYLIEGENWEALLQREEALRERAALAGWPAPLGISRFVPSQQRQAADRALQQKLATPATLKLLGDAGLRDDLARRWVSELAADSPPLSAERWLTAPLSAPYRHLVVEPGRAILLIPQDEPEPAAFLALAEGLPGVTAVDKAGSVSALFRQYRQGAATWLPLAVAIVGLVLIWRYGLRNGAAILLPTLLGMGTALALYGYSGQPLTLFSWMGLMLVLGVGANYAIFLFEAGDRAPAPFAGVILSAATTLLAFGLLALSSMPALRHFGLMLLIGISASVCCAPLALTLGKPR